MKLSVHYNRASGYISLIVLFVGAIVYFFVINYIGNNQIDSNINEQLADVKEYIKANHLPPFQVDLDQDHIFFIKTGKKSMPKRFFDTVYHNPTNRKTLPGRAVEDIISDGAINYKITITASKESTRYLIEIITFITLLLITGLLVVLFITNKYVLNGLWMPFYTTLNEIKDFNISETKQFRSQENNVDEFNELNKAIYGMSTRVKNEYENLKQFTENASHEMMTPLAVVITKLDTFIQDETLRPDQLSQITDIYASVNRSTRLNQSLLLLVKMDNNLIHDDEQIDLKTFILEKTIQFQELIQTNDISVSNKLVNKRLKISKQLLDILLNNLFSNAIRHNFTGGKLEIILTETRFTIKNTGNETPLPNNLIFERFQKSKESHGTGLGLTLVRNICQYYGFRVQYVYADSWHNFVIDRPTVDVSCD